MKLEGRTTLVTGAASGIGRAIAVLFGREGASVMASDINEEGARAVAAQIEDAGGEARAIRTDTSREADVQAAIQATVEAWGRLDVIVNNAGIGGPQYSWDQIVAVNQSGVFYGCLHALAQMQRQGGGAIVNMASMAGLVGATAPGFPGGFGYPYIAAKHAVVGLTRQFGLDGAPHRVRVNAICPGWIDTPLIGPLKDAQPLLDWAVQNTPLGRLGQPEEIARAALFLASDDSSFMTGAYLVVDGGWTAR
ncbi:MAG: SDR family NAD(P)-dependent oxidoreductase [Dehalococcoidia bacterium]|nr:SDR family NAD(P)-dependent oxidoreductase [Dehalococcoidia bacterium]